MVTRSVVRLLVLLAKYYTRLDRKKISVDERSSLLRPAVSDGEPESFLRRRHLVVAADGHRGRGDSRHERLFTTGGGNGGGGKVRPRQGVEAGEQGGWWIGHRITNWRHSTRSP